MERDGRELCSVELSSFLRGWEGWLEISGAGSLRYSGGWARVRHRDMPSA